ncbi:unnamed protein product [Ambrosiozyma monospora]|uniref:Unnamed protein product n=1 Tax=Ambrosiozyma monospora TaxID=43982 RepID=A0ACB5U079_AMBMO|nr:unnamed protein product [Ambrosiozyma monospora]
MSRRYSLDEHIRVANQHSQIESTESALEGASIEEYHPTLPDGSIPIDQTRRRSSRRGSVLDIGGANSIKNFASSLRRSANYLNASAEATSEFIVQSPISLSVSPLYDSTQDQNYGTTETSRTSHEPSILITTPSGNEFDPVTKKSPLLTNKTPLRRHQNSVDERTPLWSDESSKNDQIILTDENQNRIVVSLKSTPVQTTFNAINILIGLGILSIPLGLHCSGWIFGIIGFTLIIKKLVLPHMERKLEYSFLLCLE